jgi:hypothetical protein
MNQYKVIVTELHSAEYHVDARAESEAHTLVINGLAGEPVESWYNETMDDVEDAYIVEIKEDEDENNKTQLITNNIKEYKERVDFFEDTK